MTTPPFQFQDNKRSGKPPVAFLMIVWGEDYIRPFFELGLNSLLAPGNIPAMASQYDCSFIFLTREDDRDAFISRPLYHRLAEYCRIEFIDIEDLIFSKSSSATITLAYERGMRSRGAAMCQTYFIYLVSDYVMADGSLRGLMRYMADGVSGITTGNFQAIKEEMEPLLKEKIDSESGVLSIPPRRLLAEAFRHLHPVTVGNTVNQSSSYTLHCNRLFWRVDDYTMIGRFYLRHMLCIKPEQDDFVIGASCDYSFIDEMCPSGNVAAIGDSDDYLVIELQPLKHEKPFVRRGSRNMRQLIDSLNKWTTQGHRQNAHAPTVFHAGNISDSIEPTIDESEKYICMIEQKLSSSPMPYRGHPYWISCIEGCLHDITTRRQFERHYRDGVFAGVLGSPVFEAPLKTVGSDYLMLRTERQYPNRLLRLVVNEVENVTCGTKVRPQFWHPYWLDYQHILKTLQELSAAASSILFVSKEQSWLVDWLYRHYKDRVNFQQSDLLLKRPLKIMRATPADVRSLAVLLLINSKDDEIASLVTRCREMLGPHSTIALFLIRRNDGMHAALDRTVSSLPSSFTGMECNFMHLHQMPMRTWLNAITWRTSSYILTRGHKGQRSKGRSAIGLCVLAAAGVGYAVVNLLVSRRRSSLQKNLSVTSATMIFYDHGLQTASTVPLQALAATHA